MIDTTDIAVIYQQVRTTLHALPLSVGVLCIILSLPLLLVGWWLMRWLSALSSAGAAMAWVLFYIAPKMPLTWGWVAAICCGILAGLAGWYLFTLLFVGLGIASGFQLFYLAVLFFYPATAPELNLLSPATITGFLGAVFGGLCAWRLAPHAAIILTLALGYIGICSGMFILCQPANTGENWLLSLLVALVTIPAGLWAQWRYVKKSEQ
jgi:hypothetical protein